MNSLVKRWIAVDVFSDTGGCLWRNGFQVVRVEHVPANGFRHIFAADFVALVADVLRAHQIGRALAAGIERVVNLAKLARQTFCRDFACELIHDMPDFVRDHPARLSLGQFIRKENLVRGATARLNSYSTNRPSDLARRSLRNVSARSFLANGSDFGGRERYVAASHHPSSCDVVCRERPPFDVCCKSSRIICHRPGWIIRLERSRCFDRRIIQRKRFTFQFFRCFKSPSTNASSSSKRQYRQRRALVIAVENGFLRANRRASYRKQIKQSNAAAKARRSCQRARHCGAWRIRFAITGNPPANNLPPSRVIGSEFLRHAD